MYPEVTTRPIRFTRVGWWFWLALFWTTQLLLTPPAPASKLTPSLRPSAAVQAYATFRLSGSNGFRVSVFGGPAGVRLVASRRHEAAIYLARNGSASQDGIHASFGKLGKIELRFHPLRKTQLAFGQTGDAPDCDLNHRDQYGYFTGTFAFRGEEGFTELRRQKLYGRAAPAQTLECVARSSRRLRGVVRKVTSIERSELSVGSVFPARSFTAGGDAIADIVSLARSGVPLNLAKLPSGGVPFRAESMEERGDLLIIRLLVAKGTSDSFLVGPNNSATVTPPKPFSGNAAYRGCAERSSLTWRGSLKVSLPGLSDIKFGGKKFIAILKPGERCVPE